METLNPQGVLDDNYGAFKRLFKGPDSLYKGGKKKTYRAKYRNI